MRISAKEAAPGLTATALVVATALALSGGRTIYGDPNGEVPLVMPEKLGPWHGETVLFCQNDQCARSFPVSSLGETNAPPHDVGQASFDAVDGIACPNCGGPLSTVSLGENNLLPAATPIFRKIYHRAGHGDILATVVFSGMERRSIHRPQRCLVSQGNKLLDERTEWFGEGGGESGAGDGKSPLRVLSLAFPVKDPVSGKEVARVPSVYGYWLFNPEFETVHHLSRFARMLTDNCFRSYRPRWGYASLSADVDPARPDAWREDFEDFLPRFRPVIAGVRKELAGRHATAMRLTGTSASANKYEGTNVKATER